MRPGDALRVNEDVQTVARAFAKSDMQYETRIHSKYAGLAATVVEIGYCR